jgi:hypothetical protein
MKVAIQKMVVIILFLFGFAIFAFNIYIDQYYMLYLPHSANQASGRVHQMLVSHGSLRFGTEEEVAKLKLSTRLSGIFSPFGVLAMALASLWGVFQQKQR